MQALYSEESHSPLTLDGETDPAFSVVRAPPAR